MGICFYNPTSTSGSNGYMNYKMSGGGSGGNSGGPGCGIFGWIIIILAALELLSKIL